MTRSSAIREHTSSSPYEEAIEAALDDLQRLHGRAALRRRELESDESSVERLKQAIFRLVEVLPANRREMYQRRLQELRICAEPPSRGGPVFDNVVSLFRRTGDREWTTSEIYRELGKGGVEVDAKAVANVLGYLARAGKIRRVARGQ